MNWPAANPDGSPLTGRSAGRTEEGVSAATLRIMREADATMSPGERDEYAGGGPVGGTSPPSPLSKKEGELALILTFRS